ncbi:unnamed protein product [Notodromas monacha]|uniref:NAD(+) diphosphatase n=1 Tax=Notodromas monacha TaxID=399045 RepID=A0A7R9BLJ2_9CRUS|nr:unnamed protein product [Notodromas monacha]CAG0917710.1 unnamed protein product [Notodromas monacha]
MFLRLALRGSKTSSVFVRRNSFVASVKLSEVLRKDDIQCREYKEQGKFLILNDRGNPVIEGPADAKALVRNSSQKDYGKFSLGFATYDVAQYLGSMEDSVFLGIDPADEKALFGISAKTDEDTLEVGDGLVFLNWRAGFFLLKETHVQLMCRASSMLTWHRNFKFCSRCGAPAQRNVSGSFITCSKCGAKYFPATSPAGIVLIRNRSDDAVLLVQHTQKMRPTRQVYYTCVAGFCDMGEGIEDAVRREVAEEVGLEVERVKYLRSQHWPFPASSLMIGCTAMCDDKIEPVIDLDELVDARWYSRKQVGECLRVADESPWKAVTGGGDFSIPPKGTAAYALIKSWFSGDESQ